MKRLLKFAFLIVVVFFTSSIFMGGNGIRWICVKTGINLYPIAEVADNFNLGTFIANASREQKEKDKSRLGN